MKVQHRGLIRVVVAITGGGRRWPEGVVAVGAAERERGEGIAGASAGKKKDLQSDFVDYIRKRRLRRLELQGSHNTFIVQCKLLLLSTPKKSSKIGKGWKDFCTFNRLEEGNILVFLADKEMKKQKIKVYVHKECNF
ncbi:hypothetical protein DEO72_LG10g1400 [Vigna unguiculata]|uniref:TF-B3 domain-containing protein n=1 Tax=Vigna unguiculata TaxID=3917 RepID=A0A4D6NBP9_VIGUN|nr:hypothetical protein DEO72_LG10g1400 [Vigna unguiculata]